jgi:DNA-binding transcriptional regulator YdaS (Cro superfamily)
VISLRGTGTGGEPLLQDVLGLLGYAEPTLGRWEADVKHPLVRALRSVGLDAADVAARLGVDPKTVERWFGGRVPYPRYRAALADLTGWTERDLWPSVERSTDAESTRSEVRAAYAHRSAVPPDAWLRLFERAEHQIDLLAYSALFLAENADTSRLLREKARKGVSIRLALGDPDGAQVARRGVEEGIDGIMQMRIRNALILCRSLTDEPGVRLRLHDTVLYASIYRADDELLVNPHVYGCPASHAPVLHLVHDGSEGITSTYLDSLERVWASAQDTA